MLRFATAVVVSAWLMVPGAQASTINVTGDVPRQKITVTIEDAQVNAVIEDLQKRYGFHVEGLENAAKSDTLTTTISGSLQVVLERLLRNWNHVIVRHPNNECGIEKVMILNSSFGSAPPQPPPAAVVDTTGTGA